MSLIPAAGTLPWRRRRGDLEVAMVHRPKYDDWSWAKGKLDPGEDWPVAAVRETQEETGLEVRLGLPLPPTTYTVDSSGDTATKEVRYWSAEVVGGTGELENEIDEVTWLDVAAAHDKLDYARDREQLRALVRADAAGATNVETKAMEAEWIDLSAATVDAVVSRWGYMLLADPEAALRETRRVLRPGGRLALAAWSAREDNPWLALVSDVLVAQDLAQVPAPDVPGPFSFATKGTVEGLLAATGFTDIAVSTVDFPIGAPTLDDWWEHHRNQSVALATATADLSPKAHYELRDAFDAAFTSFVQADGSVVVPARALMASAEA